MSHAYYCHVLLRHRVQGASLVYEGCQFANTGPDGVTLADRSVVYSELFSVGGATYADARHAAVIRLTAVPGQYPWVKGAEIGEPESGRGHAMRRILPGRG